MFDYKVIISLLADSKIDGFLDYVIINCKYRNSGFGIEEEMIRIDNERYNSFVHNLRNTIEEKLSRGILGEIKEQGEDNVLLKKVIITIKSYNVVLFCKQYLDEKVIVVEDLYIKVK